MICAFLKVLEVLYFGVAYGESWEVRRNYEEGQRIMRQGFIHIFHLESGVIFISTILQYSPQLPPLTKPRPAQPCRDHPSGQLRAWQVVPPNLNRRRSRKIFDPKY